MYRIMFICLGNICRSPMAELMFKDMLVKRGIEDKFTVASSATSDWNDGCRVYPPAAAILSEHNIDSSKKRADSLKPHYADKYDLFVCMDSQNVKDAVAILGKKHADKCVKLLSFTGSSADVSDPYYTRDFKTCYNDINRGLTAMLNTLLNEQSTTEIYLVRHGKSEGNVNDVVGGGASGKAGGATTDIYELSIEGKHQAEELSEKLKNEGIDAIYASTLKRAVNTAEPLSSALGIEVQRIEELCEQNLGCAELMPREKFKSIYPQINEYRFKHGYYKGIPGQEEQAALSERVFGAVKEIACRNYGKKVLIVSHACAIKAFLCKALNIEFDDIKEKIGEVGNAAGFKLIYKNGKFTLSGKI